MTDISEELHVSTLALARGIAYAARKRPDLSFADWFNIARRALSRHVHEGQRLAWADMQPTDELSQALANFLARRAPDVPTWRAEKRYHMPKKRSMAPSLPSGPIAFDFGVSAGALASARERAESVFNFATT